MKFQSFALNLLVSISLFCLSFYISWNVNAATNFNYSTWYEVLNLDHAINKYAPNNKYKHGFENTTKQQHVELFSGIVKGIQKNGEGLRELNYKNNKTNESLLTDAEVVHLEDVASLVNKFKILGLCGFILAMLSLLIMYTRNISISKFIHHLVGGIAVILFLILLVIIIGPTKIFYIGHELVFPDKHQWFFYYEESLMSTMMKAPALFGPIACQLLLVTIVIWLFMIYVLKKIQSKFKTA